MLRALCHRAARQKIRIKVELKMYINQQGAHDGQVLADGVQDADSLAGL